MSKHQRRCWLLQLNCICDLMAIRPFHTTLSRNRLVSLFRTCHSFSSNNFPPSFPVAPISVLRRFATSAATSFPRPRPSRPPPPPSDTLAQKIGKSTRRPGATSKAKIYTDINVVRPKEYWDYESLAVQWG